MKKIIITTIIATMLTTSTAKASPLLLIPAVTIAIYKGSQALNHISGGKDGETLTENDYQGCEANNTPACVRSGLYSVVFFPADTIGTIVTGKPELIGSSHGKIWREIDKKLPVISNHRKNYGGHNYIDFITKKK